MKTNLVHYRTCVCNINYHIVWSVKYRRSVLTQEIEIYLKELVQLIAKDKGFTINCLRWKMEIMYMLLFQPPKLSITSIVKYLKGISGRKLFEAFPKIRTKVWNGELWNHSYYVETVGCISEETVKKYIENQSKQF